MKPDPQTEILRRLKSAAGHLNAVIEMAEQGQPCEDVLHQLNAVEAALRAASLSMVALRVHTSEAVVLADPSPARRSAELKRLLDLYSIMLRGTAVTYEVSK